MMLTFICYPKCSTCRKAQKWLDGHGIEYALRDIKEERPTLAELSHWLPMSGLEVRKFFNTSGQAYRNHEKKEAFPIMSADEILFLLSLDGMLVKRPLLIGDDFVLAGFKEEQWAEALGISTAEAENE